MSVDKMRRRPDIQNEWPINAGETMDEWTDRLTCKGTEYGVYRQCSIGWHGECSQRHIVGESCPCRCACHVTPIVKRFSDAELAAEYHKADRDFERTKFNECSSGEEFTEERWALVADKLNTLKRFATLPHCDEVT